MYIVGDLLFAFATDGWMMFIILIPYCLGGISEPSIQGIISNQVPDNEQGEIQGIMTSVLSVSSIIGPLVMTNLFAFFTSNSTPIYFPGAPFILGCCLTAIGIFIAKSTFSKFLKN